MSQQVNPVSTNQQLIERFVRYVKFGTAADPASSTSPSSPSQLLLGRMLKDELEGFGLTDVVQDEFGQVSGVIPPSSPDLWDAPLVVLNSHIDTSPEAPSENVAPRIVAAYDGGVITLGDSGVVIDPRACEDLNGLVGKTLIVTDGKTLLGGDDKAGVAVIMQLAKVLMESIQRAGSSLETTSLPTFEHGPIRVLFTCDEEIGLGTRHIQIDQLSITKPDKQRVAPKVAYTLDGGGQGEVDQETFSADKAVLHFRGSNIHPAIAKGKMINALRAASMFVDLLPTARLSPESTEGREGFVHPYDLQAGVGEATLSLILRDFDAYRLREHEQLLRSIADEVTIRFPGLEIDLKITQQYRNMVEGLKRLPQAVDFALEAYKRIGIEGKTTIVRGGTDGSQFTAMGLPTPNLSVGQHNIHSVREFVCVEQMVVALEHLTELLRLWAAEKP
jgi:tripeptide aminopeptidase